MPLDVRHVGPSGHFNAVFICTSGDGSIEPVNPEFVRAFMGETDN